MLPALYRYPSHTLRRGRSRKFLWIDVANAVSAAPTCGSEALPKDPKQDVSKNLSRSSTRASQDCETENIVARFSIPICRERHFWLLISHPYR
jgi:hypothetical protein